MSTSQTAEIYEADTEFDKISHRLRVNHSSNRTSDSIEILLQDLVKYLSCHAVALIRYEYEYTHTDKQPLFVYPQGIATHNLVNSLLDTPPLVQAIRQMLNDASQESVTQQIGSIDLQGISDNWPFRQVDIIPLPRIDKSIAINVMHLFLLVDADNLTPSVKPKERRDSQRQEIAQILEGWWSRITRAPIGNANKVQLSQLYNCTLSELLDIGIESAPNIRRHMNDKSELLYHFGCEDGTQQFDWEKWIPLLSLKSSNLSECQGRGKSLTYWCRWVNSHDDLEREQVTQAPSSPSDNLKQGNHHISVTHWVQKQRESVHIVCNKLGELRELSAEQFIGNGKKSTEHFACEQIQITPNSLQCYGLNQWLAPEGQLINDLRSGMLSDIEFCRLLHSIAVMAHYSLGEQVAPQMEDVIHRLIQHLAYYGHRELGIPERIDLRAYLLHSARGEPALHALKQFYRDHFFHAVEVCLLGHLLLNTRISGSQTLWQLIAQQPDMPKNKKDVLRLWYLAALLHDTGYAIDVMGSSLKFLGFFQYLSAPRDLNSVFKATLKQLSPQIQQELDIKIDEKNNSDVESDHGIVGALALHSLLGHIASDDKSVHLKDYIPAIQAIALHNLRRQCDTICFNKHPLAFLLALCDQLQEWRRPRLPYSSSPDLLLASLNGGLPHTANLDGGFKSMHITMQADPINTQGNIYTQFCTDTIGRPHIEFTLEYDERINRNSNIFQTWLDATLNFQRFDFEGFPLEITTTFITPCYKHDTTHISQSQMHRLRNAVHETHMPFMDRWFPTNQVACKRNCLTNGAVTYIYDEARDTDTVSLALRNLSQKPLITMGIKAFWDHMHEWQHFNDDRDFPGDYVDVKPE